MDNADKVIYLKRALRSEGLSEDLANGIEVNMIERPDRICTDYRITLTLNILQSIDEGVSYHTGDMELIRYIARHSAKALTEYLSRELPTGQVIEDKIILSLTDYERLKRQGNMSYLSTNITS